MTPYTLKYWDFAVMLRRLAILYIALAVCRVLFYYYNITVIGPIGSGEFWPLLLGSLQFDTVSILYINLVWVVACLLPFRFRERRWYGGALFWYYAVVNSAAVCINLSDAVYFRYAHKRFTSEEVFFAENDNSLQLIVKFAAENWYLVLAAVAIIWLMLWLYRRRITPRTAINGNAAYYAVNTLILCTAVYLCFGGIRGGFTRATRPITLSNANQFTASPAKANLILSNPFCILRTVSNGALHYTKYYPQEELDALYTPCHDPAQMPPSPYPSLEGRNVVVFILESFSAEHSALLNPDLYPDGGGFTPFLDSLMRSGFTMTDAYSNGRKSIEALPSLLSSIPSFKTPFVLMPQALGPTRPLPAILAGEGYQTSFFCGSTRGSMGFGAYATSAGITGIYGREDYQKAHGNGDFDGYWGIWDEPFIGYMGEVLTSTAQPFFSAIFTLSSHHPFVVPEQYRDVLPSGHTKVHKGVAYTDMAIRRFFEKYGGEEWFRNAVFVFSADHVSSEIYAEKTKTPTGNTRIISFIYTPDGAVQGQYPHVSQQVDIMPTLLGMMDYREPYFAFGRDLLREPGRTPLAVNYADQMFQGITDSLAVFFDEKSIVAAYHRTDTLQKHNLAPTPLTEPIQKHMQAVIQQYYNRLERKDYTCGLPAER